MTGKVLLGLQVMERESSASEPVLFITTPGADPSQELAEYAQQRVGRERFQEVAMGQGQAEARRSRHVLAMSLRLSLHSCFSTCSLRCPFYNNTMTVAGTSKAIKTRTDLDTC